MKIKMRRYLTVSRFLTGINTAVRLKNSILSDYSLSIAQKQECVFFNILQLSAVINNKCKINLESKIKYKHKIGVISKFVLQFNFLHAIMRL